MLITLPLKKHSDLVNPRACCQLQTMQQSTGRVNLTQPHPECLSSCPLPAQDKPLPSLPFLAFLFLLCLSSIPISCLFFYHALLSSFPQSFYSLPPPFPLISEPPSVLSLPSLLSPSLSSIIPFVQRHNSRLSLEERTFHLLHTLTSLSLMNAFTPLVYKIEGVIHNQAEESMYTLWTS